MEGLEKQKFQKLSLLDDDRSRITRHNKICFHQFRYLQVIHLLHGNSVTKSQSEQKRPK